MEKIRLKAFLHTFVLALLLAPILATAATTYTWVDDQGVTHFSQFPPEHGQVRVITPYTSRPPTPAAQTESPEAATAEPPEQPQPAEPSAEEQAVKEQLETVRADNCRKARANLNTLTTGGRLRYTDAEGNVRFLTDEERQTRIEEAQGQIEEYCTE